MAALEMPANGEASHNVGEDIIHKALDSVEDRLQKVSFIFAFRWFSE